MIADLARSAWMFFKASKYDARSCSPVEAMKCGTPTARALIHGDDDLLHNINCLRGGYSFEEFYPLVEELYTNGELRERLAQEGLKYSKNNLSWEYWINHVQSEIFGL
jgi:glycosyltransferase involved in cell wall biosynthesis